MVKDPIAGRAPRPQSVAIATRLLIATLRHRHRMPHRKFLHTPSELHHRATHRQPTSDRDITRVPRTVVHVDPRIRNRPDVHAIENHPHTGRPTDRRSRQPMHKYVRIRHLARQRRLLDPRPPIICVAAAPVSEVPISRTLSPIRDLETCQVHELRILHVERSPARIGHKQLRLRRIAPAVRKVCSKYPRMPRRRPRRHRWHRAVRISLAVDWRPAPRCRRFVRAWLKEVHRVSSRARPHHHRVTACDPPSQRVRGYSIGPQIPQPTHRARPIHTTSRVRRIMPPVTLPLRGRRLAHKRRPPIRPHIPSRPPLTSSNHPELNRVPRRAPTRKAAGHETRCAAPPTADRRRARRSRRHLPMPVDRRDPLVGARPSARPLERHAGSRTGIVNHNPRAHRHRRSYRHLHRQSCPRRDVLELPLIRRNVHRPRVARVLREYLSPCPLPADFRQHVTYPHLPRSGVFPPYP